MKTIKQFELLLHEDRTPYLEKVLDVHADADGSYNDPGEIARLIETVFLAGKLAEEHVWLLGFDAQLHCVGVFEVSRGGINQCFVSKASIIKRALLSCAALIVLVHNHPSGNVEPSSEDIALTKQLQLAAMLCDIELIDHIIIGAADGGYCSMFKQNLLYDKTSCAKRIRKICG